MYSDYFERDIEIDSGDKEILLDIYERVAKQQGFEPDYDNRELVDFEEDTALLDTVLYHVHTFGRNHEVYEAIAHVFDEEREVEMDEEMADSWFRLNDEAISVVRKMLDPENEESVDSLEGQFMDALSEEFVGCFVDLDFDGMPWNFSSLSRDDFLVVYDKDESVVAVVGMDAVLQREDFLKCMKEHEIDSEIGNFGTVWMTFMDRAPRMKGTLRERMEMAVKEAGKFLEDPDFLDGILYAAAKAADKWEASRNTRRKDAELEIG